MSGSQQRRKLGTLVVERNGIIVGTSGSGKSEIINGITHYCDKSVVEAKLAPKSVTKEAIFGVDPISIDLCDKMGVTESFFYSSRQ